MQLCDRGRIEQLARELSAAGHRVGERRAMLRTSAEQLAWRSSAAGAFEARLAGLLGQLARAESRLDELAGELRAHGERAAHRAEAAGRAARSAARTAHSAAQVSLSMLPGVRAPW
jgi:ABC-type transporter Mla subunit MlaD